MRFEMPFEMQFGMLPEIQFEIQFEMQVKCNLNWLDMQSKLPFRNATWNVCSILIDNEQVLYALWHHLEEKSASSRINFAKHDPKSCIWLPVLRVRLETYSFNGCLYQNLNFCVLHIDLHRCDLQTYLHLTLPGVLNIDIHRLLKGRHRCFWHSSLDKWTTPGPVPGACKWEHLWGIIMSWAM